MNEQTSNDDLLIQFVIQELGFHLQFIICASLVSCLLAKKILHRLVWCGERDNTTPNGVTYGILVVIT